MIRGVNVVFAREFSMEANERVRALADRLYADTPAGVTEIVPGLVTVYVEYEASSIGRNGILDWLRANLARGVDCLDSAPNRIDIPIAYNLAAVQSVSSQLSMAPERLIELHSSIVYTVLTIGFSPGQPYLGIVDPLIRIPRKAVPIPHVPAYTVGIANYFTSITAFAQPTGWDVLGQALERIYDPNRREPALLKPGDRVRFVHTEGTAPTEPDCLDLLPRAPSRPFLRVREAGLLDLIVDRGRFMVGRFGLPRSGPLDSRSHSLANHVVGNPEGSPALEVSYRGPVLEAMSTGVVAFAGWGLQPLINGRKAASLTGLVLRPRDLLSFEPAGTGVRGYVAVRGGIQCNTFHESASVSLRGQIGRPLRAEDIIGRSSSHFPRAGFGPTFPTTASLPPSPSLVLRIVPGPQASSEALDDLTRGVFYVASGDRMGVRLRGPRVLGGEVVSEAVPLGAIQVPPGGTPILLLNDRGTTGGYSKPALIHPADLPRVGQLRAGVEIQFKLEQQAEPLFEELEVL